MHLSIEISPKAEAKIAAAIRITGQDVSTLIEELIDQMPIETEPVPQVDEENAKVIALLRSWTDEDQTDDVEELERRDLENDELMRNLQANAVGFRKTHEAELAGREEAVQDEAVEAKMHEARIAAIEAWLSMPRPNRTAVVLDDSRAGIYGYDVDRGQ